MKLIYKKCITVCVVLVILLGILPLQGLQAEGYQGVSITLNPGETLEIVAGSELTEVKVSKRHDYVNYYDSSAEYDSKSSKESYLITSNHNSSYYSERWVVENTDKKAQIISISSNEPSSIKKIQRPALKKILFKKGENWRYLNKGEFKIPKGFEYAKYLLNYYNYMGVGGYGWCYDYGDQNSLKPAKFPVPIDSYGPVLFIITSKEDQMVYGPYDMFEKPDSTEEPALSRQILAPNAKLTFSRSSGTYDVQFHITGKHNNLYSDDSYIWSKLPIDYDQPIKVSEQLYGWRYFAVENTSGKAQGLYGPYRLFPYSRIVPTGIAGKEKIKKIDPNKEDSQSKVSDPINTATGAYELERALLAVTGAIPISFQVNYNSILLNKGALGTGWNHNFETSLEEQANKDVVIHWNANRENTFSYKNGTYTGQDQAVQFDTLIKSKDGAYTLTRQDQTKYYFNSKGQLTRQENRHGQSLEMKYNDAGQLETVREPISGQELYFKYNANQKLENVSDKLGRHVTFTYDDSQNIVGIIDASGNKFTYTYNENGQILTGADSDGKQIFKNTYDSFGRVETQDDAISSNQVTKFQYDEMSQLGSIIATVTDRNGNKKVYTHDSNYQLLSIKDELGNTRSYTYDAKGNRVSSTDEKGNTTRYSYDTRGNVLTTTDPAGNTATRSYDNRNNLLSVENAQKKKTIYTYDSNNCLLAIVDAANQKTTYMYDKNGLLLSIISPLKGKTTYSYQKGLLSTVVDPTGTKTGFTYDAIGRMIKTTDGKGKSTTTSYDNTDNITSVIDPLGSKITYTYNYRGDQLSESDPNGNTITYQYNENGKLTTQIDPYGKKTQYTYDGEDRLIKVVDSNGNASQFSYDAKGQLIQTTDALGNTVKTQYDAVGNVVGMFDALGNKITSTEYDTRNNPTKVTDALGNMTTYTYDALNRNTQVTDALKRQTKYSYDSLNRLVSSTDPAGSISKQGFDADGNQISQTDANGNSLTFTFDKAGRLTSLKNASGNVTKYAYNSLGQLVQTTNGRGQVTTYTYDDAGHVITMKDPVGTVSYAYDKNGNRTSVKDQNGTISYVYDQLNRLIKYTDVFGNTIQYGYDAVGNITKLTYPDGKTVQYTYDKANRLTKVMDWKNRATMYTYDKNGQLVKTTRPNGSIETRTYNIAGQLTGLQDVTKNKLVISKYGYTYDKVGNVLQEKTANGAYNMTYSALDQLINRKDTDGKGNTLNQYQYSYDKTGNILSVKDKQAAASMTYGADNRLTKYNTQGMVFDKDGNMTKGMLGGKLQSFVYDARNRLTSAGGLTYQYDVNNNRIGVTQNKTTTRYVVNPNDSLSQVLMETDGKGKPTSYYVYGLGLLGKEDTSGTYSTYHYDRRGSTIALTNVDGSITDKFEYGTYGEVKRLQGKTNTSFLYNGRDGVMTDLSGLYYMRARYYNAEIKRFINEDVLIGNINLSQELNRYSFVQGNPANRVDPTGNIAFWDTVIAGGVGAVVGLASQGVEDLVVNHKVSDWKTYAASATGGAVTGAMLTINPFVAGAAGEAVSQTINISSHDDKTFKKDFSVGKIAVSGIFGKFSGNVTSKVASKVGVDTTIKDATIEGWEMYSQLARKTGLKNRGIQMRMPKDYLVKGRLRAFFGKELPDEMINASVKSLFDK